MLNTARVAKTWHAPLRPQKSKSAAEAKDELERLLASELAARKFSYLRSDGSNWTLALRDVVNRAPSLEMA